ncbi:MAG: DegT/DnrJ/EryC1/StrS family aminotransferase [Acidobacteria bacterium]|nr:DegT/DnrJ/EryC1/StrS family aminotransferase [Acidobacteriota bacterium]
MAPVVPVFDLQRQYAEIRSEVEAALSAILARGSFILGEEVSAFEREFAEWCGTAHAVGVASGTDALRLALTASGIGPGDEVITVSHTAVATVAAVHLAGASPVFVDVDPFRCTLDPARLEAAITPQTRAIVPVHLYGCPADLAPILDIAARRGLTVIEDCAQAHGARYRDRGVGSWGRAGAFSFYPTKNLGAFGDAGAVVTDDAAVAARLRMLREYGWRERYVSTARGINSRLDELQAGILRVKLRRLGAWSRRRADLAARYAEALAGSGVALPRAPADCSHAFHLYVVRHSRRDSLRAFLAGRGIGSLVHYPVPVHLQPAYRSPDFTEGALPESEKAAREVLSLPFFPELTDAEVWAVCEAVREWAAGRPQHHATG